MGAKAVTYAPKVTYLASADELRAIRKELDEVRSQVRQLSDRIVPSWQGAGVSVEEAPEELKAHLGFHRGLIVRRVREGSPAEKIGLKANDVVPDLLEAQLLQAIEAGTPLQVIRQGQKVRPAAGK
jgi:S1-C subfamily serine protease